MTRAALALRVLDGDWSGRPPRTHKWRGDDDGRVSHGELQRALRRKAWRRRRAGASRGGKPPAARRARWDGSRWVELDTDDSDPTQSKTKTTHAAAPPRRPFTSGASVQRPPGPSAYDPTVPFAPKTSADSATHESGTNGANGTNGSHQMYQSDDAVDAFARWDAAEALRWARVEREDEERQRLREEREEEKIQQDETGYLTKRSRQKQNRRRIARIQQKMPIEQCTSPRRTTLGSFERRGTRASPWTPSAAWTG